MILIEKAETYGWEAAIRGMRNPKNSWDRCDTAFWSYPEDGVPHKIGEKDLGLMKALASAGTDHGKFLRMITVTVDFTAPLYWWKEFDTYKVGTVANSCSTMHKIQAKEIELSDFSIDDFYIDGECIDLSDCFQNVVADCESLRKKYLETGDKKYWRGLIQLLPCAYNQKRTVQLNYAVLKNIYHARKNHKLDEWKVLCDWVETLPYSELITE